MAGVSCVGHGAAARVAEEQRRRHDPPENYPVHVGVLERAQQVARESVHHRDQPGSAPAGLVQALALDPGAHAIGEVAGDASVVDVTDGGMVQLGQRFGLAHEPGTGLGAALEVDSKADLPLEGEVARPEQHPLG